MRLFYHREKPSVKSLTKVFDRKMFRLFGIFRFWSGALAAGLSLPAGKTVLDLSLPALHTPDGRLLTRDVRLTVRAGGKAAAVRAQRRGKIDAAPPLDSAARRCYDVSINQQEVSGRCAGNFRFMIQPFSREEYALPREAPAAGSENPCAFPLFLRPFSRAVFPLPVFGERSFLYRHLCLLSMPFPLSKGKRAPQARAGGGGISIFPLLLETSKASRPCTRG